jgi:hypothetical protein
MARLLSSSKRSRRVAPEQTSYYPSLTTEQRQLDSLLDAQLLSRTLTTKVDTNLVMKPIEGPPVPWHLIRQSPSCPRKVLDLTCVASCPRKILELTCVKVQSSTCGTEMFRVALPDDDAHDADLRRRRIYELNKIMRSRDDENWLAYRKCRRRQMRIVECCLDVAGQRLLKWALRRFAERGEMLKRDQEAAEAKQRAEAQAASFARCLCQAAGLPQDEPILKAMPLDTANGGEVARPFCPWNNTVHGCPLLSTAGACPLSHDLLPAGSVTWPFRRWAQEKHGGWIGQRPKIG